MFFPGNKRCIGAIAVCLCAAICNSISYAQPAPCTIETVAGGSARAPGDGGPALQAEFLQASDVRVGPDGLVYIADSGYHRIRRITADGRIETFAGTGVSTVSGDGGPAREAGLGSVGSLAFGPDGSLYFIDSGPRIRRIAPDGVITTIAGGTASNFSGDGGPAIDAGLQGAARLAVGPDGSVYLTAQSIHRIRRVTPDGRIDTIAGTGESHSRYLPNGDGGPAGEALLDRPLEIETDSTGVIYFTDSVTSSVRRISTAGTIDTHFASGASVDDGTPKDDVRVLTASSLRIDAEDRLYWLETGRVRRFSPAEGVETLWTPEAETLQRIGVAADGRVYGLSAERVVQVTAQTELAVVAGVGRSAPRGDGGPALDAIIGRPVGLALGPQGEIYIVDSVSNRVRVLRNGTIDHFAGTGEFRSAGDGGPAAQASFQSLGAVAAGPDGSVFIADRGRVRRVGPDGVISTFAGQGMTCNRSYNVFSVDCGDGGPATEAAVSDIEELETDSQGNLYILHRESNGNEFWVRKVTADGIIQSIPRNVPEGFRTGPVRAIAVDEHDNLVLSQFGFGRGEYLRLSPQGEYTEVQGAVGFLYAAERMAMGPGDRLFANDELSRIMRLTPEGVINTIVPRPDRAGLPDLDGPADQAALYLIEDLVVDSEGNLLVSERTGRRVRLIRNVSDCGLVKRPQIAYFGVMNAAAGSLLAPGTIVSIFGAGLGPAAPAGGVLQAGRFTTEVAGVRVLVNGVAAPLLYVSDAQINAIIPYATEVAGTTTIQQGAGIFTPSRAGKLQVEYRGVLSDAKLIYPAPAAPAIFAQSSGLAAALNQDGSVNGPLRPAAPGSVIVLFATGEGPTDPPGVDGRVAGDVLPRPVGPVEVTIGGEPAEVIYAGAAPGLVSGVLQVNARISPTQQSLGAVLVRLRVGDFENRVQAVNVVVGQ